MIINGSFDNGLDSWHCAYPSEVTIIKENNKHYARVGENAFVLDQTVKIERNTDYKLTALGRKSNSGLGVTFGSRDLKGNNTVDLKVSEQFEKVTINISNIDNTHLNVFLMIEPHKVATGIYADITDISLIKL